MPPKSVSKKAARRRYVSERDKVLTLKEKEQEYGEVLKTLGDLRMNVYCYDDKIRIGRICGRIKKRTRITVGDIVLVSLRVWQDDKCDIIEKYNEDDVKKLKKLKQLPAKLQQDKNSDEEEDKYNIVFGYSEEEEKEYDLEDL
jgi:translation initiation factor 1A